MMQQYKCPYCNKMREAESDVEQFCEHDKVRVLMQREVFNIDLFVTDNTYFNYYESD
jgi:hypothetical protein